MNPRQSFREPIDRRQWLQASGAAIGGWALAAGPLAGQVPSRGDERREGWVDAHAHIWTRDVDRFPLREGVTTGDLDPPSFTDDELLAIASRCGVGRVVLIAHHIYYGYDNSYLIAAARQRPETFRVIALIDEGQPDVAETMRRLHPQHVTGFRITPFASGEGWLDSAGMRAMWSTAAETGQAMCCLINPEHLPEVDRACERFPETTVVIDHFARIGVDGRINSADVDALCRLARHARTLVKVSAFYALGQKRAPYEDLLPLIRRVIEAFGCERLMWASDAPYQVVEPHTYEASLDLIANRLEEISDEERGQLLSGTANRVFFGEG